MRLDRFLAHVRCGSRKEVKQLIRKGRVTVDQAVVTDPGYMVEEDRAVISVNGEQLRYREYRYYMMNKPPGYITATEDRDEKTVLDLMDPRDRTGLFPVGRLDKDTTGLLLLTDDGQLAHRLLSPKKHVDKKYYVQLDKAVQQEDVICFAKGLQVDEEFTAMPALLERDDSCKTGAFVTIREGKYHQVKRMFAALGNKVLHLKRIGMGQIFLDETLGEGEYRELTDEEERRLKTIQPPDLTE